MPAASDILPFNHPTFDLREAFAKALSPAGRPDDDEGDEGEDDEGDDDADEGDDDAGDDRDVKDPEKQRLSREAAKHRTRAKEEKAKRLELEKRLRDLEDKDNDDEKQKLERDLGEATTKLEDATNDRNEAIMRAALAEAQLEHGRFKDPEYIDFLLRREDDIEVDEDGDVIGLEDWVKDLAKKKPALFVSNKDDDDDEGEDEDEDEGQRSKNDSGRPKKKKKGGSLNDDALKSKFPALAQR